MKPKDNEEDPLHNLCFTSDILTILERRLDLSQRVSLVFLLYDNYTDVYEQIILITDAYGSRNYELLDTDLLKTWASGAPANWKEKLIEALLIIQAYKDIKMLGLDLSSLWNFFLPKCQRYSVFIHPLKKVLYYTCTFLSNTAKVNLVCGMLSFKPEEEIVRHYCMKYLELFIMKLTINGVIKISSPMINSSTDDNQSDVMNFTDNVDSIKEICNHLISIENFPKSSINSIEENDSEYNKLVTHKTEIILPYTFSNTSINRKLAFNTLQYLEKTLCLHDKISLAFLLFENVKDLEKILLFTKSSQDFNKTAHEFQFFNDVNLLHNFLQSHTNNHNEKILEALLIIHANTQINFLDVSMLKIYYTFPECLQNSLYIHPYKKALYAVCESLNGANRRKIIDAIKDERKDDKHKIVIEDTDVLYFEMFLLKLMKIEFIQIKSWKLQDSHSRDVGDSSVAKFSSILKRLKYYYQYNILESCQLKFEAAVNEINVSTDGDTLSSFENDGVAASERACSKGLPCYSEKVKRFYNEATRKEDIQMFILSSKTCHLSITLLYNLESFLKMSERFSLVFLLYDDFKKATKRLNLVNIHYLECHTYSVSLFSDFHHGEIDFWREKLIEGCFIIQNERVLELLEIDKSCDFFLPNDFPLAYFINPVKKILLNICKVLTDDSKMEIITAIIQEQNNTIDSFEQVHVQYFELFLLKLLSKSYISLGTWLPEEVVYSQTKHIDVIMSDVGNLAGHLKKFISAYLHDSLKDAEKTVNNLLHNNLKFIEDKSQSHTYSEQRAYSMMGKIRNINALHKNDAHESMIIHRVSRTVFEFDSEMAMIFLLDDRKVSECDVPLEHLDFESCLNEWALNYGKYWKDKIYETLFITNIKTYYLNMFNVDFTGYKNSFSPKSIEDSLLVHPVKKALYAILQSLSIEDRCSLFGLIHHTNIDVEAGNQGRFFIYLMDLINRNLITLGSWTEKHNVANKFVPSNIDYFGEHLKALDLYYHYYVLKSSEIFVNRQSGEIVDEVSKSEEDLQKLEKLIERNSDNDVIARAEVMADQDILSHLSDCELELYDQISLLFLVFDTQEDYASIQVETDLHNEDFLKDKCMISKLLCSNENRHETWKEKLIEAFLIIHPSSMIELKNLTALHDCYLPMYLKKSKTIHPVKKTLHAMCEALNTNDRSKIIESISNEGKYNISSEPFDTKYFELYLIKLINEDFITLGSWKPDEKASDEHEGNIPSNVRNLALHLMKNNLNAWCDKLMTSEKIANKNSREDIEDLLKYIADKEGKYLINSKNSGMAIIINQKKFYTIDESLNKIESLKFRTGSDEDRDRLKSVWHSLGFQTTDFEDLEKDDIIPKITEAVVTNFKEEHGAFVLCVMSHGERGAVYGSDTRLVGVDEIVTLIDSFKILKGKPKIVIIQCCQGNQNLTSVTVESDSSNMLNMSSDKWAKLPRIEDLLVFWSTIPGHLSYRDDDGTWFIKTFCLNLEKSGHLKSFLNICIDVNSDLSRLRRGGFIQMSEFSYTMKKQLYFDQVIQS